MVEWIKPVWHGAAIVLGIGLLIFVHELGHFIAAKLTGVRVEIFSIGFWWKLFSFRVGETEYRVSAVPLGGYVKMAGENPVERRTGAPDELTSKSAGARLVIFSAGVVMNLLAAFPLAVLAYCFGMFVHSPEIAEVRLGSAEWHAGLRGADTLVALNGEPLLSLDDYRKRIMLGSSGEDFDLEILRDGEKRHLRLVAAGSRQFGLWPPYGTYSNLIKKVIPGGPAERAGLRPDDEILSANGRPTLTISHLEEEIAERAGLEVELRVRRADEILKITVVPQAAEEAFYGWDWEVLCLPEVAVVETGSPAEKAGLRTGDLIHKVGGLAVTSWKELVGAIRERAGVPTELEISRHTDQGAEQLPLQVTPEKNARGFGLIGIGRADSTVLAAVPPGSSLDKAGMRRGDKIVSIAGKPVKTMSEALLAVQGSGGQPQLWKFQRGDESSHSTVVPEKLQRWTIQVELAPKSQFYQPGFVRSLKDGIRETWLLMHLTVVTVWKLIRGDESPRELSGPIGIFHVSYRVVSEEGAGKFLWLLTLISINLGFINILPIPILDGGHVLFLAIEKIKGRPLSENSLIIAQYIGLLLIVSLVLYVTYNDIFRWL